MTKNQQDSDTKLTIECRIESGCLGPTGRDHLEPFCAFAISGFRTHETDQVNWDVVPRQGSLQAEVGYKIVGKNLSRQQAEKYLGLLGLNLAELESQIEDRLIVLIEQYMGREEA